MNKTRNIKIDREKLSDYLYSNGYIVPISIKIDDRENNRFTDVYLRISEHRGRFTVSINHERGYPSEEKGITTKTITLSWLSNELPKTRSWEKDAENIIKSI